MEEKKEEVDFKDELEKLAMKISSGEIKKIIILSGAGISKNAGLNDL